MSETRGEENAAYPPPLLPRRPERPGERGWPSPAPMPLVPTDDVGKVLKQILSRLDAIETRLKKIEKILAQKQQIP